LIEKWGRGTNRVAEMCQAAGIPPPDFAEIGGAAVVTFEVPVSQPGAGAESRAESGVESGVESLELKISRSLVAGPLSKAGIAGQVGLIRVTGHLSRTIASMLKHGVVEQTIPEKPGSRLQRYRLVKTKEGA
jgi:ATP-dependent DNA helicase RecG